MSQKVLWSGRFEETASDQTLAFTSSLSVDRRMAMYDIVGSLAHARMLGKQGILPESDVSQIIRGLQGLLQDLEKGELRFDEGLEDIHSNIELLLVERVGDAGARLHTARSRNDQVATDFRMFLRDSLLAIASLMTDLQLALIDRAAQNLDTIMPGFTHTQHAQPVTLAHHLMAHEARFQRDLERFIDCYKRLNICPLGSSALAGTTYQIDRAYTATALGFDAPCENSMDGVSDRDFAAEFSSCCALTMMHLSSLCEEIVLWSSPEFGFAEVSDAFATGSSIMPQKKNPDVAELVRGRSSLALGDLISILTLMKGLPLTYNRDLQEDKGIAFRSSDLLASCLDITGQMITTLSFRPQRMLAATERGYLNATELADYLVLKGVPFRTAHEITGKAVRYAMEKDRRLEDLSLAELRRFSKLIQKDVKDVLTVQNCVSRRTSYGGTSQEAVRLQINHAVREVRRGIRVVDNRRAKVRKALDSTISAN